jgi:hypothetical protein
LRNARSASPVAPGFVAGNEPGKLVSVLLTFCEYKAGNVDKRVAKQAKVTDARE